MRSAGARGMTPLRECLRDWQLRHFNRAKPAFHSNYEDDGEAKRWAQVMGQGQAA